MEHLLPDTARRSNAMNRNILYLATGLLVVVVAVVGYQPYKERQKVCFGMED